jgi:hypothetical protein
MMNEFANEVSGRVVEARRSLAEALATGDDYLVGVRVGELDSLTRLAFENGVDVTRLTEDVSPHRDLDDVPLPG